MTPKKYNWFLSGPVWLFFCTGLFLLSFPAAGVAEPVLDGVTMKDAQRLELTAGMSFVLDTRDSVSRVIVGKPETADVRALSQNKILINATSVGSTNLILWYEDGSTQVYHVSVKYDTFEIKRQLAALVPEATVTVESAFGMLMVSGRLEDTRTMERVLGVLEAFASPESIKNMMTVTGSQQVQLEAKIVEVSKSAIKRYGLNIFGYSSGSELGIGLVPPGADGPSMTWSGTSKSSGTSQSSTIEDYASGTVGASDISIDSTSEFTMATPFANAFQLAFTLLSDDVSGILSLLKSQGLATVKARPTLVAMSGQEASFLVGGSFPIPVSGSDGSVTVSNQEYGVELTFCPTVIAKDTIHLTVETRVSDVDYSTSVTSGGATVPGVTTREAESTLMLKDGQTFAIAGLLMENISSTVNKVPLLGDLPVVGAAFRTKEYIKEETELVIMITPRLVKPMNPGEIPPLPGDTEVFEQDDFEFFFLDHIWKNKPDNPEIRPVFAGPSGFEE